MEFRKFGNTDLQVSAIAFGCWIADVDWWGYYSEEQALRLMRYAHDQGITFFDNGDAYGNGRAEIVLGRFLKTLKRDQIQIGGKFGYDFYSDPARPGSHREPKQDFSPRFMRFALEKSLQRLGTDYIDLYMAHDIKLPQFRDHLFAELDKVRHEGKIRLWGLSLGPAIGWREEGFTAIMDKGAKALQTVFNLFEQNPGREFCELANAYGAGILARAHDCGGILRGNITPDAVIPPNDHQNPRDEAWRIYGPRKLELIRKYADAHAMTVHQLACRWLLMHGSLTSITATLLNEREIKEAAESVSKPRLTMQEMQQIAFDYANDWNLGPEAHPCDLRSSVQPGGRVRSGYVPPPVVIA